MSAGFTESVVEEAALAWLGSLGWQIIHGRDIAPDTLAAGERRTFVALCDAPKPQLNFSDLRVKDAEKFIGRAVS